MGDTEIEALVLFVEKTTNIAKCYSEPLDHEIRVQIPGNLRVPKGTYIVLTDCTSDNDVWMPTVDNFKTRKSSQIRFHAGVMLIEAMAACSTDAEHKTFNKKLAYAGGYGFVLLSDPAIDRGVTYHVELAINDGALPGEPIFRIDKVRRPVVGHLNKPFIEKMMGVENKEPKWEEWPENLDEQLSDADTSQNTVELPAANDHEPFVGNEMSPETRANVSIRSIERDSNTPDSSATLTSSRPKTPLNSSVSTWLAPPLPTGVIEPNGFGRDKAIAANKEGPLMIVYLCTYRRPARMMWQELDGRSVTLGDIFTCEFKKINPIDHVDLEVTRVVDVLPEQNTCRIDDSNTKCELGTSVDMSYSDPKLNACRKFGINPIMNCEFGFLMIADYVVDPSGNRIKAKPLIDQYDKVKSAKNMVGFCHYVLHQCPMTLFDENAPPEDRDMAYIWELFELTSTADLFVQKQDVLDHNNLGSRRDQLKEEDDIARTKRLNKERALAESRIRNSQAGSEYTPSYAPSQERMSSSQSYHTDNSRPPSSVYGSAFSGRSDLNRTPVPMSSQQSCHSSNFGQHASGPAPYMNNAPIPPTLLERSMNRHVETIRTLTAFINHIEQQFSDVNINLNHLKGEREDIQMIVDEYYRSGSGPSTASYRC